MSSAKAPPTMAEEWTTTFPDMPSKRERFGMAVTQDKLVCAGGCDEKDKGERILKSMLFYDSRSELWSTLPDMKSKRCKFEMVVTQDNKLVCAGGDNGEHMKCTLKSVDSYDFSTKTWSTLPDMLSKRAGFGMVVTHDNKLVCAGGDNGDFFGNTLKSMEVYDFTTKTWSFLPDMPSERSMHRVVLTQDNKLVCAGGRDKENNCLKTVVSYDFSTETWSFLPDMPSKRSAFGMAVTQDNTLVCAGGVTGGLFGSFLKSVVSYDFSTKKWSALPDMPSKRAGFGMVVTQDNMLVCAGGSHGRAVFSVYKSVVSISGNAVPRAGTKVVAIGTKVVAIRDSQHGYYKIGQTGTCTLKLFNRVQIRWDHSSEVHKTADWHKAVKAVVPAECLTSGTVYYWECDVDGNWMPYNFTENSQLEGAYEAKLSSVSFVSRGVDYTFENLQSADRGNGSGGSAITSVQVNVATKKARTLRRSSKVVSQVAGPLGRSSSSEPVWQTAGTSVSGTDVIYHTLSPGDFTANVTKENQEWNNVTAQIINMCHGFKLDTIKHIYVYESPNAKAKFRECREAFKKEGKNVNPVYVFHGTPQRQNADSIVTSGFRIGGQNGHPIAVGTKYGQGVYSDTDPMDPRRYGNFVLMCKGLPGTQTSATPEDDTYHTQGYDSWIPANQPKWRVWKTSAQLLPLYVIEFDK